MLNFQPHPYERWTAKCELRAQKDETPPALGAVGFRHRRRSAAFIVFSFIFIRSLLKLRRERQARELGSKIKTRLLVYFIAISFLPVTAMAVFSYLFLNRSLEKWFPPFSLGVMQQARDVQREALAVQVRDLRDTGLLAAAMLSGQPESNWQRMLDQMLIAGR